MDEFTYVSYLARDIERLRSDCNALLRALKNAVDTINRLDEIVVELGYGEPMPKTIEDYIDVNQLEINKGANNGDSA